MQTVLIRDDRDPNLPTICYRIPSADRINGMGDAVSKESYGILEFHKSIPVALIAPADPEVSQSATAQDPSPLRVADADCED